MAHKKAAGSTSNGRDSNPKMRGTKMYDGQFCKIGNIIVRQKGTKIFPGPGVSMGSDFTLFANKEGKVKFSVYSKKKKIVSVI